MAWAVEFHPECEQWARGLSSDDQESLVAAVRVLSDGGPSSGRPLVDSIKGSRHKNMKELRPPSSGRSEIRVLFAFDPQRQVILLVGGDKAGRWTQWYERNIPIADDRYDEHLESLPQKPAQQAGRQKGRRR